MITFVCDDCKAEVTDVVGIRVPNPPLCLTCMFIRDQPEEARAELRRVLKVDE